MKVKELVELLLQGDQEMEVMASPLGNYPDGLRGEIHRVMDFTRRYPIESVARCGDLRTDPRQENILIGFDTTETQITTDVEQ